MKKSEPMLVGDIIRQMLSDPRIKALIDDYGMMGLGTYIYLRNSFDAHFDKGLPHDYLVRVVAPLDCSAGTGSGMSCSIAVSSPKMSSASCMCATSRTITRCLRTGRLRTGRPRTGCTVLMRIILI